jgi:hypothetical protein
MTALFFYKIKKPELKKLMDHYPFFMESREKQLDFENKQADYVQNRIGGR